VRRLLIIFLMLLLPAQWTWAAVASACQHETGVAAQHVGHHEHEHQQAGPDAEQDRSAESNDQAPTFDADCHTCHGACISILMPVDGMTSNVEASHVLSHYVASFADRFVEHPLRPPRALLA
jgi:hypothetical protein